MTTRIAEVRVVTGNSEEVSRDASELIRLDPFENGTGWTLAGPASISSIQGNDGYPCTTLALTMTRWARS